MLAILHDDFQVYLGLAMHLHKKLALLHNDHPELAMKLIAFSKGQQELTAEEIQLIGGYAMVPENEIPDNFKAIIRNSWDDSAQKLRSPIKTRTILI